MDTGYTPVFDIFCVCGRISAGSNKKRPYKRSCYDKRGFPRECLSRSGSAGCAKPGMANNRHPACRFGVLGNRSSYVRASCAPLPGALCLLTVLVYHRVMDKLWPMLEEMEKKRVAYAAGVFLLARSSWCVRLSHARCSLPLRSGQRIRGNGEVPPDPLDSLTPSRAGDTPDPADGMVIAISRWTQDQLRNPASGRTR